MRPPIVDAVACHTASPDPDPRPYHTAHDRFDLNTPLFRQLEVIANQDYLDLAGFPHNYHSLNTIQLYGRRILPVDDFALHLVWKENPGVHLIKALPDGLLDTSGSLVGKWWDLHLLERSILYSYLHLIQGRRDLDIATGLSLVPEAFSGKEGWSRWATLCFDLGTCIKPLGYTDNERMAANLTILNPFDGRVLSQHSRTSIHIRYWYGDLRLSRLNDIAMWSRLIAWLPWEKYNWTEGLSQRGHFFQTRNPITTFWTGFGIYIVLAFGYLTTGLTAMQVALAIPATSSQNDGPQSNPDWFSDGCRVFSYVVLFTIIIQAPLAVLYVLWVAVTTWLRRRRNKRRNPALTSSRSKERQVGRKDTEMGSQSGAQVEQAAPGARSTAKFTIASPISGHHFAAHRVRRAGEHISPAQGNVFTDLRPSRSCKPLRKRTSLSTRN